MSEVKKISSKGKNPKIGIDSVAFHSNIAMGQWMTIFQAFVLIGITIFTIAQIAGITDGNLAAYVWFLIGVVATWVMTVRLATVESKRNKGGGWLGALKNISVMLPNLAILIPLSILIYVMIKVRPILDDNADQLPTQFAWFNRLTFFLVVIQMLVMYKFYASEKSRYEGQTSGKWRSVWIAAMILFSVLTSAAAVELYVIITSFLTDG